jgi:thioredoxin reductase (NADPH)
VLLVDRDYTSTSPAVREMTLGHADFHIVRPSTDDESMHRAMSEYLSSWKREHESRLTTVRLGRAPSCAFAVGEPRRRRQSAPEPQVARG